jgi:outer membrane protein OmpA-like peptidoglycan-associated protein
LVFGEAAPGPDASAEEVVAGSGVYYAFLKRRATGAGEMTLSRLADILKDNPSWKLRVIGHTDKDEFNEGKINPRYRELGYKRAEEVVNKFGELGIGADRFVVDSMEETDPASTRDSDISRAKNRRVVFELIK